MKRLLVIGIDGADWQYVGARMAGGGLPRLASLAREGSFGPLRSTVPPLSCPAWPTMTTGLAPGNLGVFDLTVPEGYGKRIVSALDVRAARLWDYVGAMGGKVVVVNVPVTWPPRPVEGVLVSCFLGPGKVPETFPAAVGPELSRRFGYSSAQEVGRVALLRMVEWRAEAFLHLLRANAWDLAMLVFSATDWAQHEHWADRAFVDRVFDRVDGALGRILDASGAENVAVLSDHGFTGAGRILNCNRLLAERGLLAYGGGAAGETYASNVALTRSGRGTGRLARLAGRALNPSRVLAALHRAHMERLLDLVPSRLWHAAKARLPVWRTPIDWRRTRAYLYNGLPQTIRVNLRGREPEGIVAPEDYGAVRAEVAAALLDARDPADGQPIVSRVMVREEAFAGRCMDQAPDLVFWVRDDAYLVSPADHPEVVWATGKARGRHRDVGIYAVRGPAFARGRSEHADLVDLTPTLLRAMGLPAPEGVDGRPDSRLLAEGLEDAGRRCYDIALPEATGGGQDRADVERRLRDLGYI